MGLLAICVALACTVYAKGLRSLREEMEMHVSGMESVFGHEHLEEIRKTNTWLGGAWGLARGREMWGDSAEDT